LKKYKEIAINNVIRNLQTSVQQNCDIADARHASDYSLCIYLLKMREYYRWEMGKSYTDSLSKNNISQWLCDKETVWETLENEDLRSIVIKQIEYDPYDAERINEEIVKDKYVYSSGLGLNCRPHFVLAELSEHRSVDTYSIYICGKELARDLPSPPAFSINNTIFIRQESVKRMIWEKIDEWKLESNHNQSFQKVFSHYDIENNLEQALDAITHNEVKSMILHEQGEIHAQTILGEEWHDMLAGLPRSPAHFLARAVRDHIADCQSTLPELFLQNNNESIYFYFGNYTSSRKDIFPALLDEYNYWTESKNSKPLLELINKAYHHWCKLGLEILQCWRKHGEGSPKYIEALIKQSVLINRENLS